MNENEEKEKKRKKREKYILILLPFLLIGLFVGAWILHPLWNLPSEQPTTGEIDKSAKELEQKGKYDDAIEKYKEGLMKEKNEDHRCIYYVKIGDICNKMNKKDEAIEYYNMAINNSQKKNLSNCQYNAFISKYLILKNFNDLEKAIKIAETLNDNKKKFYSYSYAANFYLSNNDSENALKFYNQTINLKNYGDDSTIGYNYIGIGSLYTYKEDYEECIRNLIIGEDYLKKANDKKGLSELYSRLAYCYLKENDIENAEKFYKKAGVEGGKNVNEIAYMYIILAQKNLNEGKFDECINFAKDAGKILDENKNPDSAKAYNILCYAYLSKKEYKKALECYDALKIENLENLEEKYKAHKSRAELSEYFGKTYRGIETEIVNVNGTLVEKDKSIERINIAIEEYKKALKIAHALNLNDSEIKYLEGKISDLSNYTKS